MSKIEFKLPDIGEGITEGEIVSWLVKVGDVVTEGQDMVEVMTDKATVTIGAPGDGKIGELRAKPGDTVPVGQVLVVIEGGGGEAAKPAASASPAPSSPAPSSPAPSSPAPASAGASTPTSASASPAASAVGDIKEQLPGMSAPASNGHFSEQPLAAPATRKLARELGVDLRQVPPSGEGGRVTKQDVEAFAANGRGAGRAASAQAAPAQAPAPVAPATPVPVGALEERLPIRGLRKRIYENMARSKRTAAHFTYVDECECTKLIALRERLRPLAEKRGVKLTYLPFIIKAVVAALKKHPVMNCLVDDTSQEMVLRKTYDIGIAVATDAGLIVPVLRRADQRTVVDIARELDRLASEARAGKTSREDLGGASFTITSLGKAGGLLATPVVNYPEVAILFVPQMKKRPIVVGDEIKVGHVMDLSLSFDHRIIDGHIGAEFAQSVIDLLQEPDELILSM